jgi:predicted PurR-regulated permease PerM
MTLGTQAKVWGIALVVFVALLVLLKGILLPFVAGMAIAYLLDPVCDRLEAMGSSRTVATTIVTSIFALAVILLLLLIVPLVIQQVIAFLSTLPDFISRTQDRLLPFYMQMQRQFDLPDVTELGEIARTRIGTALAWLVGLLEGLITQGLAIANLLSLIFITPVVAFYLLRDWDRLIARVDDLLPRDHADVMRQLAKQANESLAGFARGQSMVCVLLAAFYAVALVLVGLPFGAIVGLVAGLLTFIPYVGCLTGFVVSMAIAVGQFDDWVSIALVAVIFVVGQVIEGNFLTPKLVGDRVGLHPVWIIFALLAGGALFGFLGLLLAVPVAALIGVLVRFSIAQYRASKLYLGTRPPAIALVEPDDSIVGDSTVHESRD